NRNGQLRLSGPNGALAASALSIVTGGTLYLGSESVSGGNHLAGSRVPDSAPLSLNGGALRLRGVDNDATTESLGVLHVVSGASTLLLEPGNKGSITLSSASLSSCPHGPPLDLPSD